MPDLSPLEAIPSELACLREIARNSAVTLDFPMPTVRTLLRHIAWQDQELARLRRLVEDRPAVVIPLRRKEDSRG